MCRLLNSYGRGWGRCARHRLPNSQPENLDVLAKRFEVKVAKLREVLLQLLGQIDSPSGLKNPDRVPRLESEGLNCAFPVTGEFLTGECPRGVTGRRYVTPTARKFLEAAGASLQRNRTLLA